MPITRAALNQNESYEDAKSALTGVGSRPIMLMGIRQPPAGISPVLVSVLFKISPQHVRWSGWCDLNVALTPLWLR